MGEPVTTTARELAVIGAGPKAIAIAAKRQVLSDHNFLVPHLTVFDSKGIAANWKGDHGYTDGFLPLGTPPEKDIGFPYASDVYGEDLDRKINGAMLDYSWAAFQVQSGGRSYADWVDRGKPNPRHRHWAEYLEWIVKELGLKIENDHLAGIDLHDNRWRLTFESGSTKDADGVVITAPGPPRSKFEIKGESAWIFNGANFWLAENQNRIAGVGGERKSIDACVIGSGETAAAVVVQLVRLLPPHSAVDVVSRGGIIYTRGESYDENRLYSSPETWLEFPANVREEFVRRTDRGVFSVTNKDILSQAFGVKTVAGEVRCIEVIDDDLYLEFDGGRYSRGYELIVDATGFRPEWFVDIMGDDARNALERVLPTAEESRGLLRRIGIKRSEDDADRMAQRIAAAIGADLSVGDLQPHLYLPMLAAFNQGPGFPNLSCLGLLSDRILSIHCPKRPDQ